MIDYQIENFAKAYDYRSNNHENWKVMPHIHEFSELVFTKSGVTTMYINGRKLLVPENHALLILPNQIHEYSAETESILRCCVFSNDFIPIFFQKTRGYEILNPVVDFSECLELLNALEATDKLNTMKICGLINLICAHFLENAVLCEKNVDDHNLFSEAICYISQNFKQDITLKKVAKELGYNEKYLSASLHALTKMNFREFLGSYRIDYAKHLLSDRKAPFIRILDVALECGFSSINSFNRCFKEVTGMTPSEYRKQEALLNMR